MTKLYSSLNWRQIILYLIPTILISTGLKQFAFLTDIELTNEFYNNGMGNFAVIGDAPDRLTYLLLWIKGFELFGLLISGILMMRLTTKTEYSWINTFIVVIIAFAIIRTGLLNGQIIKEVTTFIGRQFLDFGLLLVYVINGLLLTALGLFIFYSKWTHQLTLKRT